MTTLAGSREDTVPATRFRIRPRLLFQSGTMADERVKRTGMWRPALGKLTATPQSATDPGAGRDALDNCEVGRGENRSRIELGELDSLPDAAPVGIII